MNEAFTCDRINFENDINFESKDWKPLSNQDINEIIDQTLNYDFEVSEVWRKVKDVLFKEEIKKDENFEYIEK